MYTPRMSQTPPPPDHRSHEPDLIDRGGHLTRWFIGQITNFLAPQPGQVFAARYLRWLMRDYLLPAEAALRRTLHLLAALLPPLAAATLALRISAHPRAGGGLARQIRKPRTPLFRLTEPPPRPRTNYLPVSQRPRISVPGMTPPLLAAAVSAQQRGAALEARLRRRLAALTAAWEDPDKAALRLQRLAARGRIKSPALNYFRIPGLGAAPLKGEGSSLLEDLNRAAFTAGAEARIAATDDTS